MRQSGQEEGDQRRVRAAGRHEGEREEESGEGVQEGRQEQAVREHAADGGAAHGERPAVLRQHLHGLPAVRQLHEVRPRQDVQRNVLRVLHQGREKSGRHSVRQVRRQATPGRPDHRHQWRVHLPVQAALQTLDPRGDGGAGQGDDFKRTRGEVETITKYLKS